MLRAWRFGHIILLSALLRGQIHPACAFHFQYHLVTLVKILKAVPHLVDFVTNELPWV